MGYIYLIRKEGKPKYVGLTTVSVLERWKKHLENSRNNSNFALHQALRKYGEQNFTIEVIEENNNSLLGEREQYWIKYYKTHVSDGGYNMTYGGETAADSLKKKCYQYDIAGNFLKEFESVSAACREVSGQSTVGNILKAINGNIRIAYGFRWSYEKLDKLQPISNKHTGSKKPIYQFDIKGKFLQKYDSAADAARSLGKRAGTIRNAALGNRKTAYGYIWSYDYIMSLAGY